VLRIHTSHRTEVLLDAFVRRLAAERQGQSAFTPIQVVVPNRNVETYLRLGVAERLGIAANLETGFLRGFLAGLAEQALPEARVADAAVVEGHLLAVLHDDDVLARPELGRVRAYLHGAGPERDAVDRRRCQLAASLARLFDEYAASRPALVAAWREGKGQDHAELASWQRALWLAVFGPGGRLARRAKADGIAWLTLEALWDEAQQRCPAAFAGRTVHVFGLSYIATAYHRMLGDLARASEVYVYTLNPCQEDLGKPAAGFEVQADEAGLHPVLARWARPGRENLRRLAGLPGAQVEQDFPAGDATTLLRRLQQDITQRRPPAAPAVKLDSSLHVLPCPSLRRELEVVAAEIWGLLRRDPSLRACDVAVIVPEASRDLYLAQLPAVFRESCDLPYNATDLPAAGSHRVAEAIAWLVDLPFSALSRRQLLPLLTHPCLMARFPSATSEAWRDLADALGIVRGADRGDFAAAYLDRDLFSWEQGLSRLALGAVTDGAAREPAAPLAFGDDLFLPGPPLDASDDADRLGFGLLARSLVADAAFASGRGGARERPLPEWLDFLRGMVRTYLVLDEGDQAGQAVVARFLAALDELDRAGLDDTPVAYRVAAELAKRALASLPASRGHYLASGVTVASFVPMRAIPFRAVFVLGLGSDAFPRPPGRDELDLRRESRLPGDVDRREQDLYLFLETLLSARDQVCLSYVCRDEITGDELPGSPLLHELRAILGAGYLDQDDLARLFVDERRARPPLRRYDDSDERRAVLPAAEAEHETKRRRGSPAQAPRPASRPTLEVSTAAVHLPPAISVVDVPLWALRQFLQDPLQGSARFLLGLRDDDDGDAAHVEDEPFDTPTWLASSILRASMSTAMLAAPGTPGWEALARAHEAQTLAAQLAGRSPAGLFGVASTARREQILRRWHQELSALVGDAALRGRTFRFVPNLDAGDLGEARANVVFRPAPVFDLDLPTGPRRVTVRLVGDTGLWAEAEGRGEHAFSFTCRASVEPRQLGVEDLRVFVEYAALAAASGPAPLSGVRSALFFATTRATGRRVRRFAALAPARAQDYLRRLCTDLLVGPCDASGAASFAHPYLLPWEAVLASRERGTPLAGELARMVDGAFTSRRGPLRDALDRYAPPPPAEAERMVEARFGLLFELDRVEEAT
jgi:exodeoxyribonuclease V gamma subunit